MEPPVIEAGSEQRIKEAARTLFLQHGYAATTVRAIAKASGANVALVNYYFRSKENLFTTVMLEHLQAFVAGLVPIIDDRSTTLDEKVQTIVERYVTMLRLQPELPLFVLSALRSNPEQLTGSAALRHTLMSSHLFEQITTTIAASTTPTLHPMHFFMNVLGMTVFPFASKPFYRQVIGMDDAEFDRLMQERIAMIPQWIAMMTRPA